MRKALIDRNQPHGLSLVDVNASRERGPATTPATPSRKQASTPGVNSKASERYDEPPPRCDINSQISLIARELLEAASSYTEDRITDDANFLQRLLVSTTKFVMQ